ncbi:hypothetical protein [Methylocystis parvus]|uniref:hypothetical protein n=1 Tax=Methylocystis parvus TaxID=134 RepID=UPI003C768A05
MSAATKYDDPRAVAYAISPQDAEALAGAQGLPVELRRKILGKIAQERGAAALVELFANFMGLANSVVANCHTALEVYCITDAGMHPFEAEALNLPTIFGACLGVKLAHGMSDDGLCAGCAFRLGTHANQCPPTQIDAETCAQPGERLFMCHEELDERGAPTKPCAGWARARKARARA